ncbi:MAG: hypothetical protein E2O61_12425 [Gammaproteobacteria bacterium]|nr:MAG: hypothetical protein E2O61_12425 [Gammaproteobacteria bacterium]
MKYIVLPDADAHCWHHFSEPVAVLETFDPIPIRDLRADSEIYLLNSVRRWIPTQLDVEPAWIK